MRETANRLVVLSGVAAAMLASAVPALAQEEVSATFELAVEGEVPEGASFFGYLDNGEPFPVALADSDGDGVYVGSYDHIESGDSMEATIVQGTGSREDLAVGASPGEPTSTIRDFGLVTFDGDEMLSAAVSFAHDEEPATPAEPAAPAGPASPVAEEPADPAPVEEEAPAAVFVDVKAEEAAEEADEENGEVMDTSEATDEERVLPSTGGAALLTIGAGALLTAAGLLVRRMPR